MNARRTTAGQTAHCVSDTFALEWQVNQGNLTHRPNVQPSCTCRLRWRNLLACASAMSDESSQPSGRIESLAGVICAASRGTDGPLKTRWIQTRRTKLYRSRAAGGRECKSFLLLAQTQSSFRCSLCRMPAGTLRAGLHLNPQQSGENCCTSGPRPGQESRTGKETKV